MNGTKPLLLCRPTEQSNSDPSVRYCTKNVVGCFLHDILLQKQASSIEEYDTARNRPMSNEEFMSDIKCTFCNPLPCCKLYSTLLTMRVSPMLLDLDLGYLAPGCIIQTTNEYRHHRSPLLVSK
jgi:hypothetical protein